MTDPKITTLGRMALTDFEITTLQNMLATGDRVGYDMVYYGMSADGVTSAFSAVALEARISTFSGPVGGVAFSANRLLQEWFGPESDAAPEYPGIYLLSHEVTLSGLAEVQASAGAKEGGLVSNFDYLKTAEAAWNNKGVIEYFPGNFLLPINAAEPFGRALLESIKYVIGLGGTPDWTRVADQLRREELGTHTACPNKKWRLVLNDERRPATASKSFKADRAPSLRDGEETGGRRGAETGGHRAADVWPPRGRCRRRGYVPAASETSTASPTHSVPALSTLA